MARPVTLFTGQWADLPLKELAATAKKMGFDGLELACWGDHFDVNAAAESKDYCKERWQILAGNGLTAAAISSALALSTQMISVPEGKEATSGPTTAALLWVTMMAERFTTLSRVSYVIG